MWYEMFELYLLIFYTWLVAMENVSVHECSTEKESSKEVLEAFLFRHDFLKILKHLLQTLKKI